MTEQELKRTAWELSSLSVFRGILKTAPMKALLGFMRSENELERHELYGEFVYSLNGYGCSFSSFLRHAVFEDENRYIVSAARGEEIPRAARANAEAELKLLSRLTELCPAALWENLETGGYIPEFESTPADIAAEYEERLHSIGKYGYGIFASAKMFRVAARIGEENGSGEACVLPVEAADAISHESFVGYERERQQVFENTRALVEGRPAANVLLFGDAGTGKSSTVKACANFFADQGVRLIELRKDQLFSLSSVMGRIAGNPLKFIIFIDDLSFNKNDDCFSMLKAALEGSASAKAANAVIYATSNRRHIVKETFSDRSSEDDVHRGDTVQELMSLSDRFGLTVYFEKPGKALYLDIVHKLAERRGLTVPQEELDVKAEAFALGKGSRSPRAAEQFISSLL